MRDFLDRATKKRWVLIAVLMITYSMQSLTITSSIHDLAGAVGVGLHPRVEDAEVVVCCDEGHKARDEHCTLVLVSDSCGTEPQIHGGGHHARQGEGKRVVHRLVLHIAHLVHHHDCLVGMPD